MKTFKAYSDPQHGWVAVKRQFLAELGILTMITRFSYQKGATVYLEEDQDVSTFVAAYKDKFGVDPVFVTKKVYNSSAPIRSYESFSLVVQG